MDESEHDVLAYMSFPREHRAKLQSNNPIERVNGVVERRTKEVAIFRNEDPIVRLVGAILLEQNDVYGPLPVCKGNLNVAADTVLAVLHPASVREPFGRRP